ncbi:hypothetical protein BD769DRAFT_1426410, partial [Suillus cothurnatus]
ISQCCTAALFVHEAAATSVLCTIMMMLSTFCRNRAAFNTHMTFSLMPSQWRWCASRLLCSCFPSCPTSATSCTSVHS